MLYQKIQRLWRFLLNQEGQQPRVPYSNFNGILKKVRLFATKNSSKLLTISDICETKIKVLKKLWFHSKTEMQFCKDIEYEVVTLIEKASKMSWRKYLLDFIFSIESFLKLLFLDSSSFYPYRFIKFILLVFNLFIMANFFHTLMNLKFYVMIHYNLDS